MTSLKTAINQATDEFSSRFLDWIAPEKALIGIESEFPVVDKTGKAVSFEIVEEVFREFAQKGWKLLKDGGTQAVVGVEKKIDNYMVTFGTDVGGSIIEIAFPPAKNLQEAQEYRTKLLTPIVEAFKKRKAYVLAYGILPVDRPHKKLLAHKGRYKFFESNSSNTFVPERDGVDLHVFSITAAAQTHVQVDKKTAIPAMNMLNSLASVYILLSANSPVWRNEIDRDKRRAVREWLWHAGWPTRPDQTGMLEPMKSIKDYVTKLASFKPQMIKRDQFISLVDSAPTIGDLLVQKYAQGKTISGEQVDVAFQPEDIIFTGGFAWFNARITGYGTVESRVICQQPDDSPFAISALTVGLVTNLDEALKLVKERPFSDWVRLRNRAMEEGFKDIELHGIAASALDIAKTGLEQRNYGEEKFLEPLYTNLEKKESPAERVIDIFTREGMAGLVKHTAIK